MEARVHFTRAAVHQIMENIFDITGTLPLKTAQQIHALQYALKYCPIIERKEGEDPIIDLTIDFSMITTLQHGNLPRVDRDNYQAIASSGTDEDVIDLLLRCNPDPNEFANAKDSQGYSVLHFLSLRLEEVSRRYLSMLLNAGADIEAQTRVGNTPLHYMARMGHLENMRVLFQYAFKADSVRWLDPYMAVNEVRNTIYDYLEFAPTPTVVRLANIRNKFGHTPLYAAVDSGKIETVRLMLEAGARVLTRANIFAYIEQNPTCYSCSFNFIHRTVSMLGFGVKISYRESLLKYAQKNARFDLNSNRHNQVVTSLTVARDQPVSPEIIALLTEAAQKEAANPHAQLAKKRFSWLSCFGNSSNQGT